MAFLAVPSDFLAFLAKQMFDDAQAEDVGRKLAAYEIFSPKSFLGFFSAGTSIYDFWKDHLDWERKGGIFQVEGHAYQAPKSREGGPRRIRPALRFAS